MGREREEVVREGRGGKRERKEERKEERRGLR
jgi:hypothetical protein